VIPFERLAMLVAGELPVDEAAAVEDHVLACDACAGLVERLAALGDGIRELTAKGASAFLAGSAVVGSLERAGLVTRRYRPVNGQIACTVDAADIYTALFLEVDTRGVKRMDMLQWTADTSVRYEDVPFDEGELQFTVPAVYVRTLPSEERHIQLIAVGSEGERVLAEFVLHHTAFAGK
jgi:hypothetical protein